MGIQGAKRLIAVAAVLLVVGGIARTSSEDLPVLDLSTPGAITLAASSGALEGFLELDDIPGDSIAKGHENEIEVLKFQEDGKYYRTSDAMGQPILTFIGSDIEITKPVDSASVPLSLGTGAEVGRLEFAAKKGKALRTVLLYEFKRPRVNDFVRNVGSESSETFVFEMTGYKVTYYPIDAGGSPGDPQTICFNFTSEDCP